MILAAIFTLVGALIKFVFRLLPNVPNIPVESQAVVSQYINYITSNTRFVSFFLDVSYTKILLAVVIALLGFRESFKFIMWIYHKLPFSSE